MRTIPKWTDSIQDVEKQEQCVYDLCFNPEGTQLIVASGNRVLVYDTTDGTLIQALKGHKDTVYCVCYAKNGQKFASGSSDKTVIIWSNKLEGLLKYSHSDAVQCLAYNPLSNQLASCALTDFAFWSAEQKAVQKHKINSRINSCAWTNDGQYLALALGNGSISIRNKLGEEKGRFERPGNPSIWAISWSTSSDDQDTLCVTDWNKTLSFYTLGGKLIGKERVVGFDALKVKYFPKGEYILISGSNKACNIYTKDGIKLGMIGDQQQSWVWCCAVHPEGNYIAMGCQDGTIAYYQLAFNTVHGLFKERYAFRENMTDVIIQHLLTEQKVRIKCRDLIKKIAIYKHRLAVQLPERVVIYELYSNDANDMHYRVKEKITQKLDCSLLVICSEHLVVCQERKLQSLSFAGVQEREWILESPIRYIKIIGGPPRQEGLILGLKNGQVWEVHLDNSFPLLKVTVNAPIRCLDLSQRKQKLAAVDETGLCQVFNTKNGDLLYQEPNTNSIAWNTQYEDMLAFSGPNLLSIKVEDFPAHRQKLNGFVVGLTGSKVFCLNGSAMTTLELPLSAPMYQYIEKKMFSEAHKVACLGVTDGDWEELGHAALENLNFDIARLAFVKLQDFNYLELIRDMLERMKKGDNNKEVMIGDVYAYRGKFKEAARLYQKAGQEHKALTMYTDLRMFDQAQDYLGSNDNSTLIRQKADWARNINEHKAAVDMYLSIGDTKSAIEILGEQGWSEQLIDVGRRLDKAERVSLLAIAEHLKQLKQSGAAAEIYKRLGDSAAVLKLHVEAKEWTQAFSIVQGQPQHKELVYVPYAHWLAENDKFVQAQKAFHKAGRLDEAYKVLQQLTENAVEECRFQDAGYYYLILAQQCLDLAKESSSNFDEMITKYVQNERLAGIYYAYHSLHRYLEEPFTSFMPEALFNIARFLMTETNQKRPKGVSLFNILYCLSKQARKLGANKLTKQLLDKMQTMKIPTKFQEQVEVATIAARAKPFSDPEDLLPMCYRCSTYNPLAATGNRCVNCGQKFVHSYVSFEILPLVEFVLEEGISDTEAVRLIDTPPSDINEDEDQWKQEITETHQTLQLDGNFNRKSSDPFSTRLNLDGNDKELASIVLGRNDLLNIDSSTVLVCKYEPPLKYQFYRNLLPDLQITMCEYCFKAFHVDDFEFQMLQKGYCPYCRCSPEANMNLDSTDDLLGI
ncbi:PREDICTED: intraflagellar transport protein 122 homolog [Nicrophorus vespilloides]|uniref:Intraflagellar transport protein 122 homolog n=1 Tax=Nicrophorus vespilloides TaxID=110193 RepID=A0ABM1MGU9_NICVS|nr:PREDICTED: intraflagellar transport protein 122 homolog [Nicrophorus vespilloides]